MILIFRLRLRGDFSILNMNILKNWKCIWMHKEKTGTENDIEDVER